ncbi:MAG: lipopolysaccharide transport periplasmic protein LptA [Rhodanobacter sp.]
MMSMPLSRHAANSAKFALAVVALSLLAAQPALAKKSDRQQQMHVASKHFDGFQKPNSVSTLTGSVVITQGSLKASGNEAKVYFDAESQISRVVIAGNPAHLQQLDDNNNLVLGDATTLDYDNLRGIAVLRGNASINQKGRGQAHGDKLTYNTQTSEMTGESGGDGLVHMTFQPQNKPAANKPATPTEAPAPGPVQAQPAKSQSVQGQN